MDDSLGYAKSVLNVPILSVASGGNHSSCKVPALSSIWEHCISAETAACFHKLPRLPYFYLHNESQPADNKAPNFILTSLQAF